MSFPRTFTITTQPYLDKNQCYKNILMVNVMPDGPLNTLVRRLQLPRLSPFQVNDIRCNCDLVLINPFINGCTLYSITCGKKCDNYMTPNEIQLTNMMNNSEVKLTNSRVVCSVTYFGNNQPNICYTK